MGDSLRQRLRRGALGLARTDAGGRLVATVAHRQPELLPGRVAVLPELVIIRHPAPSAPGHLLAVPRTPIDDALAEATAADAFWNGLADWLDQDTVARNLHAGITNVGRRQDVALLHVHLLGTAPAWMIGPGRWAADSLADTFAQVRAGVAGASPTASYGFTIHTAVPVAPRWRVYCDPAQGSVDPS
jgi:diadenosine tetraphosphate (Ap4A) HIT family hydrolase